MTDKQKKLEEYKGEINKRADRVLSFTIAGYFLFGIFLAFFYDTWLVGLCVGFLNLALYFGTKLLLPKQKAHHYIGSLVMAIFMAQFIYQMHGLFEMHFTAFIAIIVLIGYQDWKVMLPATIFIVIHHASFAYIQYLGVTEGNEAYQQIYFTQLDYMDLQTFLFHVGLVAVAVVIAGATSIYMKTRSMVIFDRMHLADIRAMQTEVNIEFAKEIANSNYDYQYELSTDDQLGKALVDMRDSLKVSAKREKQEKFMNAGLAKLSDIIRDHNGSMEELTYQTITFLVKYMELNQGGIFIAHNDKDDKEETYLELQGCYAFERRKRINQKVGVGEGLVGQCYLEKDTLYLTEIPEDYIRIKSGLGDANPRVLIIVPIKRDAMVEGVMELAGFQELEDYQIEFLKEAGESIAVAINTTKVNERTNSLYQQSLQQTEEMKAQEEEMRQNMEEMEATQEEISRKNKEIEKKSAESRSLLNGLQSLMSIIEFEPNGTIIEANENFLNAMDYSLEDIQGKHHRIFASDEFAKSDEYKSFWKELGNGHSKKGVFERFSSTGNLVKLNAVYTPILDDTGSVQKVVKLATVVN
jgi:methyl-accepting chemotaxis protein